MTAIIKQPRQEPLTLTRRTFLAGAVGGTMATVLGHSRAEPSTRPAQIAITLDLEMSRHYHKRGIME